MAALPQLSPTLASPTLAPLALAALGFAACGPAAVPQSTRESAAATNVLLITIDTLRADHLSCYGYERETSPNLDALAAEGLRFDDVSTPRAKTTPAIASLLTGRYPHDHGVRDLAAPLAATGPPLLQERLRDSGWRTAAIIGNYVLTDARSGLARGFERWIEELPDLQGVPPHAAPQRTAGSLTDAAIELLEDPEFGAGAEPCFLWLHYMDPHGAYAAPVEHRVFGPSEPSAASWTPRWVPSDERQRVAEYNAPPETRGADGRIDAARVVALYDAEIRYVDAELGRLLAHLRASGLLERTLVLVTADHGESLGEHDYWFEHGAYAYQATCRVPLIARWPASLPAPSLTRGVVSAPLSLVDLAPTVLAALGIEPALPVDDDLAGRSALGLLDGRERAPVLFLEKVERADLDRAVQIKAARVGDWKLIRRYAHVTRDGERELRALSDELFELTADPLEARDLLAGSAQAPPEAPMEALRAQLLRFAAADTSFPELDQILRQRREALERSDPEALRVLEALGY